MKRAIGLALIVDAVFAVILALVELMTGALLRRKIVYK